MIFSESAKHLETVFDFDLTWEAHVEAVAAKLNSA